MMDGRHIRILERQHLDDVINDVIQVLTSSITSSACWCHHSSMT